MISNLRIVVVSVIFLGTFCVLQASQSIKETPIKRPLREFPQRVGLWTQANTGSLSDSAIKMLRPDDYIDYTYTGVDDGPALNLFVSYYGSLENDRGYHSPRNCIPANGWNIVSSEAFNLSVSPHKPKPIRINMLCAKKGIDRILVFYWYQSRGRVISSEYWEKIYLVWDSIFKRRRDGSLVMITVHAKENNTTKIVNFAEEFAKKTIVLLEEFIPGT